VGKNKDKTKKNRTNDRSTPVLTHYSDVRPHLSVQDQESIEDKPLDCQTDLTQFESRFDEYMSTMRHLNNQTAQLPRR
jgi:hypothetical protein